MQSSANQFGLSRTGGERPIPLVSVYRFSPSILRPTMSPIRTTLPPPDVGTRQIADVSPLNSSVPQFLISMIPIQGVFRLQNPLSSQAARVDPCGPAPAAPATRW